MNHCLRWVYTLSMLMVATGCTVHAPRVPATLPSPRSDPATAEMASAYYHRLTTLDRQQLQDEYEAIRNQPEQPIDVIRITKLALLFTVPDVWADPTGEQRALDALEKLDRFRDSDLDPVQRDFLYFAQVWKKTVKLRRMLLQTRKELEQVRRANTGLERQNNELNRQIEALKKIEQHINRQEQLQE